MIYEMCMSSCSSRSHDYQILFVYFYLVCNWGGGGVRWGGMGG